GSGGGSASAETLHRPTATASACAAVVGDHRRAPPRRQRRRTPPRTESVRRLHGPRGCGEHARCVCCPGSGDRMQNPSTTPPAKTATPAGKKPRFPGIRITTNGNQLVAYHTEARI